MKKLLLSAVVALAATVSMRADDIIVSDNNPADVYLNVFFNSSYQGEFDLRPQFVPGSMTITNAYVEFTFWDLPFLGGNEVGNVRWDLVNATTPSIGGFTSFSGFFTLGDDVTGAALGELNADGTLLYTVTITRGEVWLTNANLTATVQVPDGGTTALLVGLGLLAIAFISRPRLKKICA